MISHEEEEQDRESLRELFTHEPPSPPPNLMEDFQHRIEDLKTEQRHDWTWLERMRSVFPYSRGNYHRILVPGLAVAAAAVLVFMAVWLMDDLGMPPGTELASERPVGEEAPRHLPDTDTTMTGEQSAESVPPTTGVTRALDSWLDSLLARITTREDQDEPQAFGVTELKQQSMDYWLQRLRSITPEEDFRKVDFALHRGLTIDSLDADLFYVAGGAYEMQGLFRDAAACFHRASLLGQEDAAAALKRLLRQHPISSSE